MKGLSATVLAALIASVAGGLIHQAPLAYSQQLYNTVIPAQTRGFAYSTSQAIGQAPSYSIAQSYQLPSTSINAYQISHPQAYQFAPAPFNAYPQIYQFSQFYNPVQSAFPLGGPSYFPGSIFYPSASPAAPINGSPVAPIPSQPELAPTAPPPGDADTAVVDSASFPNQGLPSSVESPNPVAPSAPQFPPASSFPSFPQFPQDFPSIPQIPQLPSFPQFPQGSNPAFPQFPPSSTQPQSPTPSPPQSFPGADNSDKGLNDEDTISVESA